LLLLLCYRLQARRMTIGDVVALLRKPAPAAADQRLAAATPSSKLQLGC
jgi:hypothetical protein